jgi:hypothetical protein
LPVAETSALYVVQDKKLNKRKNPFSFIFIPISSVNTVVWAWLKEKFTGTELLICMTDFLAESAENFCRALAEGGGWCTLSAVELLPYLSIFYTLVLVSLVSSYACVGQAILLSSLCFLPPLLGKVIVLALPLCRGHEGVYLGPIGISWNQ